MQKYIKIILRGVSQVMLQNNALTGLLFLVGIFYNSWLMGLGALIGNIISTITAVILKYSKKDIENGLYGFNGTLLGIAVWFYFGMNIITLAAIMVGAIISTIIMLTMKKRLPALTAPFVISAWVLIIIIKLLNLTPSIVPLLPQNNPSGLFTAISMSFGQVMFQGNVLTGIIFFLAIIINSRTAALYALYGALLGGLFATVLALPLAMISIGLFGYNAILCGIALGDKKCHAFLLATSAIILSVLINFSLDKVGIITLTAPFVAATWIILLIKKFCHFHNSK